MISVRTEVDAAGLNISIICTSCGKPARETIAMDSLPAPARMAVRFMPLEAASFTYGLPGAYTCGSCMTPPVNPDQIPLPVEGEANG